MNICFSELIILNNPVVENVDLLVQTGCDRVELMMDGAFWDSYNADFRGLVKELRARDVHYSVHPAAWDINLTAETRILREAAFTHHVQALQFAAEIGASQIVIHPGFLGIPAFSKEVAQMRAKEYIHRLAEMAKNLGVRLAFENVGFHAQSIYAEEEYVSALDGVDTVVGYLIDVGHAHINGWNIPQLIERTSDRLFGLHIHDNNGKGDQHLPMYEGSIKWDDVFQAMKTCKADCEFILEYSSGTSLDKLVEGKNILLQLA